MTSPIKADPMGEAILHHLTHQSNHTLEVHSSMFETDEIPVDQLFRKLTEMPAIEQKALQYCKGHILDVGAGAGCHTLELEKKGYRVTSIDISKLSTKARRMQGAKDARCIDFFNEETLQDERFDTILMLMNGLGLAGSLKGLPRLLTRARELMAKGGQILADSSDLLFIFDNGDGTYSFPEHTAYYGEVDYSMTYGPTCGEQFKWLYVDYETLANVATLCGLKAELMAEGDSHDYLCRLTEATPN